MTGSSMARWRNIGVVLATAAAAACADQGPVSGPGTLTGTLVSPNGAEGAAYVILVGDGVEAVTGVGDAELHSLSDGDETHLVMIHPSGGVLAFQVAVADTTKLPGVLVLEVAGPDDELRGGLESYSVEFAR